MLTHPLKEGNDKLKDICKFDLICKVCKYHIAIPTMLNMSPLCNWIRSCTVKTNMLEVYYILE